jgi:hypothetical protein
VVDFVKKSTKKSLLTLLRNAKNLTPRLLTRLFEGVLFKEEFENYVAGGGTSHGDLGGLADDDHTRYLDKDGTRALTGDWDAGAFDIRAADLTADSGGVYTDTITELTADAGVTIDSVVVKDSGITVPASIDWSGGNTIYVPLSGDIQTYVTAAVAGDTLVLASGVYTITSTITINKQLNIRVMAP